MSIFKGDIEGHEITVSFNGDMPSFQCTDLLEYKRFDSWSSIERAVRQKLLTLRKDFSNPKAYRKHYRFNSADIIEEVTVTCLDMDEKYAWINVGGKREKASRESLFADMASLEAVSKREKELQDKIRELWAGLERWKPQP